MFYGWREEGEGGCETKKRLGGGEGGGRGDRSTKCTCTRAPLTPERREYIKQNNTKKNVELVLLAMLASVLVHVFVMVTSVHLYHGCVSVCVCIACFQVSSQAVCGEETLMT